MQCAQVVQVAGFNEVYPSPSLPVRYTLCLYGVSYREGCVCIQALMYAFISDNQGPPTPAQVHSTLDCITNASGE